MTSTAQLPLLFLDVDGPLIPFGAAQPYPTYETGPEAPGSRENPLLARINPQHGPRLTALPCELVWATTWREDANTCAGRARSTSGRLIGLQPAVCRATLLRQERTTRNGHSA